MSDMICPWMGAILYYFVIFTGIYHRYDLSGWGKSFLGGDLILFTGTYLISILIVALYCNLRPFNMWGVPSINTASTNEETI